MVDVNRKFKTSAKAPEITLDPEDREEMRLLGHRMIDDLMSYFESLRDKPIAQPFTEETLAHYKRARLSRAVHPSAPWFFPSLNDSGGWFFHRSVELSWFLVFEVLE